MRFMHDWFSRLRERLAGYGDSVPGWRQFCRHHARHIAVVGAVLGAALAVVLAVTLSGSGAPSPASNAAAGRQHAPASGPVAPVAVTPAELAKLPRATTYTSIP